MKKNLFLVALLCSANLSAQIVPETGAVYEHDVRDIVENVIRPIVASRPRSERQRLGACAAETGEIIGRGK